jgi:hypothetical protein
MGVTRWYQRSIQKETKGQLEGNKGAVRRYESSNKMVTKG